MTSAPICRRPNATNCRAIRPAPKLPPPARVRLLPPRPPLPPAGPRPGVQLFARYSGRCARDPDAARQAVAAADHDAGASQSRQARKRRRHATTGRRAGRASSPYRQRPWVLCRGCQGLLSRARVPEPAARRCRPLLARASSACTMSTVAANGKRAVARVMASAEQQCRRHVLRPQCRGADPHRLRRDSEPLSGCLLHRGWSTCARADGWGRLPALSFREQAAAKRQPIGGI